MGNLASGRAGLAGAQGEHWALPSHHLKWPLPEKGQHLGSVTDPQSGHLQERAPSMCGTAPEPAVPSFYVKNWHRPWVRSKQGELATDFLPILSCSCTPSSCEPPRSTLTVV